MSLLDQYRQVRALSEQLCEPLAVEDYNLQAVAETSPLKWHLAHTSWFFEAFLLKPFVTAYSSPCADYEYLFNSYYNGIGEQYPRAKRSLLSRPSVEQVYQYRYQIDQAMQALLSSSLMESEQLQQTCILGLHHEQQHQELMLTDLKYNFFQNPLLPAYRALPDDYPQHQSQNAAELEWREYRGGKIELGYNGDGFCFDNELPRHEVIIQDFMLADRLVSNREFLEFIQAGGYQQAQWWLSDGWSVLQSQGWTAPLYWLHRDGQWYQFTLYGLQPMDWSAPVCHISAYEADAFARWSDARLPTESEWEYVAKEASLAGQFLDSMLLQPQAAQDAITSSQLFGYCWQWTSSSYAAYPGFRPASGAVGEYNGKFMCNQLVLRGGSCASSRSHLRPSYRNFFYPADRWQFSGLRLARSL